MSAAVFTRRGDVLVPSGHARGPWAPDAMHGGAPSAALAGAVERRAPGMRLARLTVELLGAVPLLPLSIDTELVKPGRSFQVVDARASAGGREVAWARGVLMRDGELDGLPAAVGDVPADPEQLEPERFLHSDGEAFSTTATEQRFAEGSWNEPGPATAWFRMLLPMVEGEEPTGAQLAAAVGDFGNGISSVLDWSEWLFVNTDLTLHLHREPEGDWLANRARTILQPNGSGLATATLYDRRGEVGTAAQSLFVARRSE